MKDTTIRLRPERQETPGFAELTGAYWLDTPIYAELASEWQECGRSLPRPQSPHAAARPDVTEHPADDGAPRPGSAG
ncbi:hypothetical protein [Streptomyces sp. HNM0574]|uniref:hypothetical protein n=1 Tax=Streptomyces sp. HNM0574 TaxID=2714954 RepID=UPI00146DDA12|nr:hypothetical protein [Streptomyces sp. HNM0574]NLU67471.1 hypothetical protein [Streptomyces sp. HNM0574]